MIQVRQANRADAKLLMQLILEMGQHERLAVTATAGQLAEDAFGERPRFHAIIAEDGAGAAGYAFFFDYYSSFQGPGVFLEDLYVRGAYRGKGVGRALLSHIARQVIDGGDFGIVFNVLDWNQSALRFFEDKGASVQSDRKTLCLTGAALRDMAVTTLSTPGGSHARN